MKNKDKHQSVNGRSRILQKLADKMKSGMKHVDAANEILNEESPGPPFDLARRKEINAVVFDTMDAAKVVNHLTPPSVYEVKSLDVWGNEDDGFEVNQEFSAGEVEIPSMCDDACLLKILKENYLKENATLARIEFEQPGEGFIEVKDKKTGEPLYFLYEKQ